MMPDLPRKHGKPKAANVTKHEAADQSWGNGRGGRPWRRKRDRILKRDGYMCQCSECKGLKRIANEVDHVVPLSQGGTDDDSNLIAIAAYPCHARKTARESARGR